ncbi:MAG: peptidoglycan editing factor PgeF [Roseburia sp.]|nr:peptidoglycan editing factor PgeF [Roseburia sp.]
MNFKKKTNKDILQVAEYPLENGDILPLLHYPLIDATDAVIHGFTTRLGGVSQGIFSSLNLSFTRGDEREAVLENYRRLAKALSVREDSFCFSNQTHTTNVKRVGREDAGTGMGFFTDLDGLITDEEGVTLTTFYADCVPLFFVDKKHHAIGLSHSGWRGTVNRMGRVTVEAMHREFGTEPGDLVCAIGPSICQDCYEVSADVAEEFIREFKGQEKEILINKGKGKYQLDLWRANEIVLKEAKVPEKQTATTNICTCCNPDLLFSHRATQGKRGNLAAVLALK